MSSIYHGFLGPGAGTLILYTMVFLFGHTMLAAKATHTVPWIVVSTTTLSVLSYHGHFRVHYGLFVLVSMTAGGYIGAHFAVRKGNAWLKLVFASVVIMTYLKLLYELNI